MDDHLNTDTDDECDWEEVDVPEAQPRTIEITLNARPKPEADNNKKKGISHAERLMRINCHKMHTVALLANASIRNKWLNDELLHARLLSLCPLKLQDAFAVIHKSRVPDQNQRGRMFENAMRDLTDWWSSSFEIVPEGHIRSRTFHDVERFLERYRLLSNDNDSPNDEIDLEVLQDVMDEGGEFIRSPNSLMKHALLASGTRDTTSQLFTALCRALSIPARLVVSIQSVPWQAGIGKPKPRYEKKVHGKGKGKGKASPTDDSSQLSQQDDSESDDVMEEVEVPPPSTSKRDTKGKSKASSFPGTGHRLDGSSKVNKGKGKEKAQPAIKLRKQRPKGRTLGSLSPSASDAGSSTPDPTSTPPIFWTEVFSKPDGRWLPVDPIRCIVNKRKVFDPTPVPTYAPPNAAVAQFSRFNSPIPNRKSQITLKQENRLVYVLAFEEDGYARDVTRRYAREFSAKVSKMQGGSGAANMGGGGKGRMVWWNQVLSLVHRPYRLHRDDIEDEELETAQMLEGMPTTMGGFKDHPIYVLARHLKQNETIHPPPPTTPELGKFRGEPVYPRSAVVSLKTSENWMRSEGRTVKTGEQPLKMVKIRASTLNKSRELEVLKEAGGNGGSGPSTEVMQGLYARSQTEPYVPEPVVNGVVPKNNFGNIDLYVPSMLPRGGAHIPYKGVAKVARKLGFDFAEAVTGFEFRKRRAVPIIEGVVVSKENEATLLEAFWEAERIAEEKARAKREERVIKQWTRLIHGLRIRQRLQEQYGRTSDRAQQGATADKSDPELLGERSGAEAKNPLLESDEGSGHHGGGFLVEADDVVQAFHLPKSQFVPDEPAMSFEVGQQSTNPAGVDPNQKSLVALQTYAEPEREAVGDIAEFATYDLDEDIMAIHDNTATANNSADITGNPSAVLPPKTMAELAEDAEAQQRQQYGSSTPPRSLSVQQTEKEADNYDSGVSASASATVDSTKVETMNHNNTATNGLASSGALGAIQSGSGLTLDAQPRRAMRKPRPPAQPVASSSSRAKPNKRPRKASNPAVAPKRRSARISGRKRSRKESPDNDDSDISGVGSGVDDADENYNGAGASRPSPRKRPRVGGGASTTPATGRDSLNSQSAAAASTPTRTLRPRTTKTAAQIEEEDRSEAVYLEAISR